MNIMLGDQSPEQIERRLHITLSDEHKKMLMDSWQHKAEDIEVGKWHCFDIPFMFLCGDMATATKWRDVEGITGFQYGCAVNILSQVLEYGEELRAWHNSQYGYKGEGTVNPAILSVG